MTTDLPSIPLSAQAVAEQHRRAFARRFRATCACEPLEIRADRGLRCARCDAPLAPVAEVRRG